MMPDGGGLVYPVPKGWQCRTVNDIKSPDRNSCVAGPFGSEIASRYFSDDGVPVIRGCNLTADLSRFIAHGFVFVSEERAQQYVPQHAIADDLVFTCWGTVGQVGLIPQDGPYDEYIISNKQLKLRVNPEIADPEFCFYYFASPKYVDHIRSRGIGGAVPGINLGILKSLRIALPPKEVQRNIAAFLNAFCAQIDNNRRRIKLLEDSVRLLFYEWFVRQQLPSHLESRSDDEPQHFSVADLCVEVKTQVLPEAIDADTPYIGLEHMPRRSITLSDWGAANDVTSAKLCYAEGDIIFGKIRPYFHKVGIALTNGVCSSDAIVMRPQSESWRPMLLALMSSDAFIAATAQGMKEGSKMPRADWKQMRAYTVRVPNPRVLSAFNGVVEPVLQQVKILALQARALRTARDLLLPRLMSGELTV